jgi:tetratricopeptide (TPR) repeat protein
VEKKSRGFAMTVVGQGTRASDSQKRARLRAALEAGDHAAAVDIARQDLALVRNFANDMLKEIKPQLSLAARRAAIAAFPEDPIVHRELMRVLILARKPDDVVAHAKSSQFEGPALQRLFLDLAEEFIAEGRPKQAIATLGAMQQSWPLDADAKRVLLKAEILTARPEQALERLNGFDLAPQERAVLLQYLAARLEIQGDKAGALKCRRAAAAAAPQDFRVVLDYLKSLDSVHDEPKRIIEALEDEAFRGVDKPTLLRALRSETEGDQNALKKLAMHRATAELAPANVTLVQEYVWAVLEQQGFDAALMALDHSAFESADRVQVLRDLGGFLAKMRKPDLALRCKVEAYRREPERLGVLYELVDALLKSDGPAGTRAYFAEKSIGISAPLATLRHFASYLTQAEKIELAISCRRMVVHLSPQSPELVAELAGGVMRWRSWDEGVAEIDRSELSRIDRIELLRTLGDPARDDLNVELAAACRAEASRRSSDTENA